MQKKYIALSLGAIGLLVSLQAKEIKALQNIVVTAQKSKERPQEVPLSMSVFGAIDLEDKQIKSIQNIGKYTPNLLIRDIGTSSSTPPSIRGLFADVLTLESSMGVYVDGIPLTMGLGLNEYLMDIERIEVLRGPQGTLYGKNTEAGVINIVSKKPNNTAKGEVSLNLGEDKLGSFEFKGSGAIIKDKLYLGVGAKHYEKDGFVKHLKSGKIVDNRERNMAKLYLRATPTDSMELSFIKSYTKYKDGAPHMGSSFLPKRKVLSDLDSRDNSSSDLNAFKILYNINENYTFQSTTTHRIFKQKGQQDFDFTDNQQRKLHVFNNDDFQKTSQEFRLNYEDKNLKYLIGLYGDTAKNRFDEKTVSFMNDVKKQDLDGKSLGIFTHIDYALRDDLHVLGGLRYDKEEKSIKEVQKRVDLKNSYSSLSPKFSLKYNVFPNFMTYFTVAKGYRAGGFNPYAQKGYPKKYDKESLYSYDLGFKSSFFDDKVFLNINLYYMDIKDMQVTANIKGDKMSYSKTYTSNAAKATSKGMELDFNARVTNNISFFGGVGLNEIKFDEFEDELGNYSGNYNKFSPKYNYNLGVSYRGHGGLYAQVDTSGYSKMFLGKENKNSQKAYNLVNAKIGFERENFDIYLYANNLFDKEYDMVKYAGLWDTYSAPREIGLKINYRF